MFHIKRLRSSLSSTGFSQARNKIDFISFPKESVMSIQNSTRRVKCEVRKDPLIPFTSRICHFKPEINFERPNLEKIIQETSKTCPFCRSRIMDVVPSFPADIVPQGRIAYKDMCIFPNLAPYDSISAVLTPGDKHYVSMHEWAADNGKRITKALSLAVEFFGILNALRYPESVYHLIGWNYMPPAGSSLIHPHMQLIATSTPPALLTQEIQASQAYSKTTDGRCYWDDLVQQESASNQRFLGQTGNTNWFMSFAPRGIVGDVVGVVQTRETILGLSPNDLQDIGTGLARAIDAYDSIGVWSFNVSIHSAPVTGDSSFRVHVIFSPRITLNEYGTCDTSSMQVGFQEGTCFEFPETLAKMVKPFFSK